MSFWSSIFSSASLSRLVIFSLNRYKFNPNLPGKTCLTLISFTLPYLPYLTLPHVTLPYLTLLYLTSPHVTLPYLTLPYPTSPHLAPRYVTLRYLTLPYPASILFTLPPVTLPYFTSSHATLPYLTIKLLPHCKTIKVASICHYRIYTEFSIIIKFNLKQSVAITWQKKLFGGVTALLINHETTGGLEVWCL